MAKSMMPQNRSSRRARRQTKQPRRRDVRHELIDLTTILMHQTNPLTGMKVLEDTMERVENDNTIKCTGNGANRKKVSGKAKNI